MKKVLIQGAAGFIAGHLEARLRAEGCYVVSIARHHPKYRKSVANELNILDLTNPVDFHYHWYRHDFDEVYQCASDGGGLGYIGTGSNDAAILTNSVKINLNTLDAMRKVNSHAKILFASSQCVYPDIGLDPFAQERIAPPPEPFKESDASFNTFPFAQEKLFSEQLYAAYARQHGFKVAVARIGNTYGPYCAWDGPRAKAPAAICRKVATAPYAGVVPLWGGGQAVRTFTYVDDVVEGLVRLMASDYDRPVNIASAEEVTIAELFATVCRCAGKVLAWEPAEGPVGVRYRGSDNDLCRGVLNWEPRTSLWNGMMETYKWVAEQALTKSAKCTTNGVHEMGG
jgi:GDP-D-mannose 3',5'-epimerase